MKSMVLIISSLSIFLIPLLLISHLPAYEELITSPSSNTNFNLQHLVNSFYTHITRFKCQISTNSHFQQESELPWPIFEYPSGYGEGKYLLRKATVLTNRSCDLYPTSSASEILYRIQNFGMNNNFSLRFTRTEEGNSDSSSMSARFEGNLDIDKRKVYFNHYEGMELPCGFANNGFQVSQEDQRAMESCRGVVVISAIFGGYDKLRQPKRVRKFTAENVCFFMFVDNVTLSGLAMNGIEPHQYRKIGLWRIVLVENLPYTEYTINGLIPKYLPHRLFPNSIYSIWTDAKIQMTVDPLLILQNNLIHQNAEIALSRHAYNVHTMEEAIFSVRWRKWNKEDVRFQMESYCADGFQPWSLKKLPYTSDVGDTALILRKHSLATNLFSCLMFNEIQVFNPRDQLAFAYVRDRMSPKVKIHMFSVNIFNTITNEYRHSSRPDIHRREIQQEVYNMGHQITACKSYLDKMWHTSN